MRLTALTTVAAMSAALACVAAETDKAILPGWGKYFWNQKSMWYIHPPAFDFTNVTGAVCYRYRVIDDAHRLFEFTSPKPTESLEQVWTKLPPKGMVTVICHGVDAKGSDCGLAGKPRTFWKNAPFDPAKCAKGRRSYGEAARMAYDYIFSLPCIQVLVDTGKPDFTYRLNCYPTKMNARIVSAAIRYAELKPESKDRAMAIARAAADYLISVSEPEGSPLAGFTPTYAKGNVNYTAGKYAGQNMLVYPADAGSSFLKLHKATGEAKYLAAAKRIADTYLRLQGEDGTWYLKMWEKDGKPVNKNRLMPLGVCDFLVSLAKATGEKRYGEAADRAFAFVEKGPLENWNWEGQFEDVDPTGLYKNLTKHPACSTAMYLLRRYPDDAAMRAKARELLRFSEDQFVAWERPCRKDGVTMNHREPDGKNAASWPIFPTVMEQYRWYVPTDSSVAKMIRTYLAFYKVEKNPADLAKAKALGDACTRAQRDSGRIPTQWMAGSYMTDPQQDWLNCMLATADALEALSEN